MWLYVVLDSTYWCTYIYILLLLLILIKSDFQKHIYLKFLKGWKIFNSFSLSNTFRFNGTICIIKKKSKAYINFLNKTLLSRIYWWFEKNL